jgi:hypothetical protein
MTLMLAMTVFTLAMLHGYLWSEEQRHNAVQDAYNSILEEVRQERKKSD